MEKEKIAIHENKNAGSKVLKFASNGCGMSEIWWKETFRLKEKGDLWGVHQTATGKLRRITN